MAIRFVVFSNYGVLNFNDGIITTITRSMNRTIDYSKGATNNYIEFSPTVLPLSVVTIVARLLSLLKTMETPCRLQNSND